MNYSFSHLIYLQQLFWHHIFEPTKVLLNIICIYNFFFNDLHRGYYDIVAAHELGEVSIIEALYIFKEIFVSLLSASLVKQPMQKSTLYEHCSSLSTDSIFHCLARHKIPNCKPSP